MRKHRLLIPTVVAGVLFAGVAVASPPSGQLSFREYGRARLGAASEIPTPAGTDVVLYAYSLRPGAHTGWRSAPGPSVLAVTTGALTVHLAEGCATQDVPVGQASVVPPGRYLIRNAGEGPVEFAGAFLGLAAGSPQPLAEGVGEAAPAGCPAVAGYVAGEAPSGLSVGEYHRGVLGGAETYGPSRHAAHAGVIKAEAGTDVLASAYRLEPGFSTGWHRHTPTVFVVTRGTLTYYEEHAGECAVAGRFSAGGAYVHANRDDTHFATNEGDDAVEVAILMFNLPHGAPLPLVGSQTEFADFTPAPPAGCPRLR